MLDDECFSDLDLQIILSCVKDKGFDCKQKIHVPVHQQTVMLIYQVMDTTLFSIWCVTKKPGVHNFQLRFIT
jgi:hypothetical protein